MRQMRKLFFLLLVPKMRGTGTGLSKLFHSQQTRAAFPVPATSLGDCLTPSLILTYKRGRSVYPILQKGKVLSSQGNLPNVSQNL